MIKEIMRQRKRIATFRKWRKEANAKAPLKTKININVDREGNKTTEEGRKIKKLYKLTVKYYNKGDFTIEDFVFYTRAWFLFPLLTEDEWKEYNHLLEVANFINRR